MKGLAAPLAPTTMHFSLTGGYFFTFWTVLIAQTFFFSSSSISCTHWLCRAQTLKYRVPFLYVPGITWMLNLGKFAGAAGSADNRRVLGDAETQKRIGRGIAWRRYSEQGGSQRGVISG